MNKRETTIDKKKVGHKLIGRGSIDKFYELVTGDKNGFYKVCIKLPEIIKEVVREEKSISVQRSTVLDELSSLIEGNENKNSMEMAFYLLGFSSYNGFNV